MPPNTSSKRRRSQTPLEQAAASRLRRYGANTGHLETHVQDLLRRTDQIRSHIESQEFSLAAINARALEANLEHVNNYANRLADSITDERSSTLTPK